MLEVIKKNPISALAVLLIAVFGSYLIYMSWWETTILTSPDWCQKAQRAERIAPGITAQQSLEVIKSCNEMLLAQISAIAVDSHIDHATFSFLLVVLVVVFVAAARATFKIGPTGIEGSVHRDVAAAAEHVVEGAEKAAAEVSDTIEVPGSDVLSVKGKDK